MKKHFSTLYGPDTTASLSSDDTSSNLLSDLEQSVSDSLDALDARGVLQKNNRVDLEDLVNSAAEIIEGEESSEEEICTAVLQRCAEENTIIVDDSDDDDELWEWLLREETHKLVQRLLAIGSSAQSICLIDKEDLSTGPVEELFCFRSSLTDILSLEI